MSANTQEDIRALLAARGITGTTTSIQRIPCLRGEASFGQRALWLAHQTHPSGAYNIISGVRLSGVLDMPALAAAIDAVLRRQAVLRTSLLYEDGALFQILEPHVSLVPREIDLSGADDDECATQLHRVIREEEQHIFDLAHAPAARICVVRLPHTKTVLLVNLHHCISDAWSQDLLAAEIAHAYTAALHGKPAHLPELPIQYVDFSRWQNELLRSDRGRQQIDYWRELLTDAPPFHGLALDRPRSTDQVARSGRLVTVLSDSTNTRLEEFAKRHHLTAFNLLLALFASAIGRFGLLEDLVLGVASASRNRPETRHLLGYFVNALPARFRAVPESSFMQIAGAAREMTLQMLSHADVPLETLLSELNVQRHPGVHPLFQIFFSYRESSAPRLALDGVVAEPLDATLFGSRAPKFELSLIAEKTASGHTLTWEWDTRYFDPEAIQSMAATLERLASVALSNPTLPIGSLPIVVDEREATLSSHPGVSDEIAAQWLSDRIANWVSCRADCPAIVDGPVNLTYGELQEAASHLANELVSTGSTPGDRIAIVMERSAAVMVALVAVHQIGATWVLLDPRAPPARLLKMFARAGCRLALIEHAGRRAVLGNAPAIVLRRDGAVAERHGLDASTKHAGAAAPAPTDTLSYITFTSGSTGEPKGAMLTRANLGHFLWGMSQRFQWPAGLHYSLAVNLATDLGLQNAACSLAFGGILHVMPEDAAKDPAEFAAWMKCNPIDVGVFTPSHFCALYQPHLFGTPLPRQFLMLEGEAIHGKMLQLVGQQLPACRIVNGYGPTETTVLATVKDIDPRDPGDRVPIGSPLPGVVLRLVSNSGAPQPRHATGELWIEGAYVGAGYCGDNPVRGGYQIEQDGLRRYRTGDRVRIRASGELEFLGRRDSQVKLRGHRIEPAEVEFALRGIAGVQLAAVRCERHENGDGRIAAYVVWQEGVPARSRSDVIAELATNLPAHMLPQVVVTLAEMPVLANGKINYRALPEIPAPDVDDAAAIDPPRTESEVLLARLWSEVLGVSAIQRYSNFFALGGSSIQIIQLAARARGIGLNMTAAMVHEAPTLQDLALKASRVSGTLETAPAPAPAPIAFSLVPEAVRSALPPDVVDAYPLHSLQEAMLASHLAGGPRTRYFIVSRHATPKTMLPKPLTRALETVIATHPALRTSIAAIPDCGYVQRVHAAVSVPLTVHDLRQLTPEEQRDFMERRQQHHREQPLPLDRAPLFAVELLQLSDERTELIWAFHHIILDGWSVARLLEEIARRHDDFAAGEPLPAVVVQSGIGTLIAREQASADEESEKFWREYLADAPAASLPRLANTLDSPATTTPIYSRQVSAETVERLARQAAGAGVALKAVFLAAYSRVIGELCGVPRLLTGCCTHAREEALGAEHQIGLYVRTLPIVVDLAPCTWRELLHRAQQAERELWNRRFTSLAHVQKVARSRSLFEHFFNFNDFHAFSRPATAGTRVAGETDASIFNLNEFVLTVNVVLGRTGEPATLYAGVDPQHLSAEQARSILDLLSHALFEIADGIDAPAELCTGDLRAKVERQWNETARDFGAPRCLHEAFLDRVREAPLAPAVIADATYSYSQLFWWARRIADQVLDLGLSAGDRVGVCFPRGAAQVAAVLGVHFAGGAYVPIDTSWPQARQSDVLKLSGARALLTGHTTAVPANAALICVRIDESFDYPQAGDTLPEALAASVVRQSPHDLAYIIFTSGSTGRPKGVAMEHGAVWNTLVGLDLQISLKPSDRVLALSALVFDLSVYDIFGILGAGGAIVYPAPDSGNDPAHWQQLLERHDVTIWNTVPMTAQMLEEHLEQSKAPVPTRSVLRQFLLSGDRIPPTLPPRLQRRFPSAAILSLGGATEAAIWSISYPISEDTTRWRSIPYGRPLPNQRFRVLDPAGRLVIPGATGELHIAGEGLAREYFGDEVRTREAFFNHEALGERLYRTGDYGRYLPDGNLEFIGRRDDQIKLHGYRIELGEIEAAIRDTPGVDDAVVMVRDDAGSERLLVAYVAFRRGVPFDSASLRAALASRLPAYMVPRALVRLDALPLSPNGKVDRRSLPAPPPDAFDRRHFEAPRDARECELAALWSSILQREPIGRHDHFFELGGDSIQALRMIAAWARCGNSVSLRDFYAGPTIAQLAAIDAAAHAVPTAAPAAGNVPLLPSQQWLLTKLDPRSSYFNQSMAAELDPSIDDEWLRNALTRLVENRDAFRLRLRHDNSVWSATLADAVVSYESLDLQTLPAAERAKALSAACADLQRSINPCTGPLIGAIRARCGDGLDRLTLVASHFSIDLVSWSLLLLELRSQLDAASSPLEHASTPAASWAMHLVDLGATGYFRTQHAYWQQQLSDVDTHLPLDDPDGDSRVRHLSKLSVTVPEWTDLHSAVGTHVKLTAAELFLCATYMALRDWCRSDRVRLLLERHGRGGLLGGPDVSRTIGWLTALSPLQLAADDESGVALLTRLLDQIRSVPDEGIGYGVLRYVAHDPVLSALKEPSIAVNFLGTMPGPAPRPEFSAEAAGVLRPCRADTGSDRDPDSASLFELTLTARVEHGAMHISLEYGSRRFRKTTVERLARSIRGAFAELHDLAENNLSTTLPSSTSSDPTHTERAPDSAVTLPATSMQEGLVLHAQLDSSQSVYVNQMRLKLRGEIDSGKLRNAWNMAVSRHNGLRISFHRDDHGALLQKIHARVEVPWQELDLRGASDAERADQLENLASSERSAAARSDVAPLLRLALVRLQPEVTELIWSYHHALLDGWSIPIVLRDVAVAYRDASSLDADAPSFLTYLRWLASQDPRQARDYWQALLQGYAPAAPQSFATGEARGIVTIQEEFPPEIAQAITTLARQTRTTPNAVCMAAWSCVIREYSGTSDVLIGTTVSGRPPEVHGAESTVGLFINTIPVRARVSPQTTCEVLISDLFQQLGRSAAASTLPLAEIQSLMPTKAPDGLFESLLVFENFERAAFPGGTTGFDVISVRNEEVAHYPLVIVLVPGDSLRVRLSYRAERFSPSVAGKLLQHFSRAVEALSADPARTICSFSLLSDAESIELRQALQKSDSPTPSPEVAQLPQPPRDSYEQALAEIWCDVLNRPVASVHDDFYDLGGQSLRLAQVIARIRDRFQAELEFTELYDRTTIAQQAEYLRTRSIDPGSRVESVTLARREAGVPLTPQQRGLWYLCQEPQLNRAYNIPFLVEVRSKLIPQNAVRAFERVISRHESLRTVLVDSAAGPLQCVRSQPNAQVDFTVAASDNDARNLADAVLRHAFDWRQEPLFRARIISTEGERHWIAVNIHHLICDAWSVGVLLREFAAAYSMGDSSATLPALSVQFGDYAAWTASSEQTARLSRSINYWRSQLAGHSTVLDISTDLPRPAEQQFRGSAVRIQWPRALTVAINAACREHAITPFMLLLSGYAILLGRLSNSDDLIVGAVRANRERLETEPLIGLLASMLPLRVRLLETQAIADYLAAVRALTLDAFDHAEAPLENIVEALSVPRSTDRMPLIQVALTLQNTATATELLPGFDAGPLPVQRLSAKFDLSLTLQDGPNGYRGEMEFDEALFAAETVECLAGYLEAIVRQLCTNPRGSVGDIELDRVSAHEVQA